MSPEDSEGPDHVARPSWEQRKLVCRQQAPSLWDRVAIILRHGDVIERGDCELAAETLCEDVHRGFAKPTSLDFGRVLGALAKMAFSTYEEPAALHHSGEVSGIDRVFGAVVYGLGILHGPADNLILLHEGLCRIDRAFARSVVEDLARNDRCPDVVRLASSLREGRGGEPSDEAEKFESVLSKEQQATLGRIWAAVRSAMSPMLGDSNAPESLAKEGPTYAIATLILSAQSRDPQVRAAALGALAAIDPLSAGIVESTAPTFASRHS